MTLIVIAKYPRRKQIKIEYETQFPTKSMLNDKIKKQLKEDTKNY